MTLTVFLLHHGKCSHLHFATFEIVLVFLVPILFLMGFVHKSFWTGKKFTIVQLLALFLLNVLSSITMGLTFALEKDNMDVTLQFGGAFAFAFEWVLLVADILFVVIPPLLSRLKSEKEKKA